MPGGRRTIPQTGTNWLFFFFAYLARICVLFAFNVLTQRAQRTFPDRLQQTFPITVASQAVAVCPRSQVAVAVADQAQTALPPVVVCSKSQVAMAIAD